MMALTGINGGKRWGFFPSASIGYRVTEEKFWQDVDFLKDNITNLKIRASYGVLGEELGTALSHIVGYNYNSRWCCDRWRTGYRQYCYRIGYR